MVEISGHPDWLCRVGRVRWDGRPPLAWWLLVATAVAGHRVLLDRLDGRRRQMVPFLPHDSPTARPGSANGSTPSEQDRGRTGEPDRFGVCLRLDPLQVGDDLRLVCGRRPELLLGYPPIRASVEGLNRHLRHSKPPGRLLVDSRFAWSTRPWPVRSPTGLFDSHAATSYGRGNLRRGRERRCGQCESTPDELETRGSRGCETLRSMPVAP